MPEAVLETPVATESLGWRAGLPDDLKQNEAVVGFKTVGDLTKDYLAVRTRASDLEKKMGDYVPKLPDNASDEDRNLYYDALGRPKQPSEYVFEGVDEKTPEAWTNDWKNEFHKLGYTQQQVTGLTKFWAAKVAEERAKMKAEREGEFATAQSKLKGQWGDKYDTNMELAKRMHQKHFGTEFDKQFESAEPATRLWAIELLFKNASLTGEDRSPVAQQSMGGKPQAFVNYDKSPAPPKKG